VQEQPEAVVLEVAVTMPDALDRLDQQVHGFGRPVGQAGAVPAEDLVFSPADRGGEAAELDDVGGAAVRVEALKTTAGPAIRRRGVHLAQQLLGEVGGATSPAGSPVASPASMRAQPRSVSRS
jgi:hypothetical protein